MRQTDKTAELEKMVSSFRAKHASLHSRMTARGTRTEQLIGLRQPLRNLVHEANNAMLCSLLYSEASFSKQLETVKAQLVELSSTNEELISTRFRRADSTVGKMLQLVPRLPLLASSAADGYTGYHDGKTVVPVYYLRYHRVQDVAGFVHADYNIWFKSGKEFSTGFVGWPTDKNWKLVTAKRDLLPAVQAALVEDGLV